MKPFIGITCNFTDDDRYGLEMDIGTKGQSLNVIAEDYVNMIIKADAVPVLIPCTYNREILKEYIDLCDGLVLTGGNDINPLRYGERSDEETGIIQDYRDEMEIYLFKRFYSLKKPVFGICRGMQIINVALGGTLYTDLKKSGFKCHSLNNNERYRAVHEVTIDEDCMLYDVFNRKRIMVNSYHHQAVRKLADSLKIVGISDDGVIEAVELKDNPDCFVLAVQWHPEMMAFANEEEQILIDYFTERCRK